MQQQQKKHVIILILSRKEDYQNLLKPHHRRFLSHCLVFERFKKVSESLGVMLELHNIYQYFSFILCVCLHKLVEFGFLSRDFFSSFEILYAENKPTSFMVYNPSARNSVSQGYL